MKKLISSSALGLCLGLSSGALAQTLSTLGTPGLVDMPTAEVFEDGTAAITTNRFGEFSRNTGTFQFLPFAYGSFRYNVTRGFSPGSPNPDLFDRNFDLHIQLAEESAIRPSIAVGLRDLAGTGVLSSEYLVATKTLGRFKVTGGLGWGRLAQRGSFDNPLGAISDRFKERDFAGAGGISESGQLDTGLWFRGPMAAFGGVDFQATDRLSFQLEYSSDAYEREAGQGVIDIDSPFNFGLNYRFDSGVHLRGFYTGGTEVGVQLSYVFNPKRRPVPGGLDRAPLPVPPAQSALLAGLDLSDPAGRTRAAEAMAPLLANEGIDLEALTVEGDQATIKIQNNRWDIEAQAIGRAARVMANVLPAQIETFTIIPQHFGVPTSAVTMMRSDLRELQHHYDGSWLSLARTQIDDAAPASRAGEVEGLYPKFDFGFGPYAAFSYFDPDAPVRIDAGAELSLGYTPLPGLSVNGTFRYPLVNTIEDATRRSDSVLPRVRSDAVLYAVESDLQINNLYTQYVFRPGKDLFGRVSAGYLENMYAGVSGELLWHPGDSRLALGVEVNYAKQRDFDLLFGLQDYDVITGHASAYYDLGGGFRGQLDVGRYLAGDWGATVTLEREFNNGFRIGGYFTLTDVSPEDFGEGSFDKGIRVTIPLSWASGQPSRRSFTQTIQPVLRDGGARLFVPNRLYETTRDYRARNLSEGWGRLFR